MFNKFPEFSKNSQGTSLKARGLKFLILPLYMHILAPVKTEFAKSIEMVDFREGWFFDFPPTEQLFWKYPGIIRVNMEKWLPFFLLPEISNKVYACIDMDALHTFEKGHFSAYIYFIIPPPLGVSDNFGF